MPRTNVMKTKKVSAKPDSCADINEFAIRTLFDSTSPNDFRSHHSLQRAIGSMSKTILKLVMTECCFRMQQLRRDGEDARIDRLSICQYNNKKIASMSVHMLIGVVMRSVGTYRRIVEERSLITCAICLNDIESTSSSCTTKCGHTFCTPCFMSLVMRCEGRTLPCPCCRNDQFELHPSEFV